MKPYDFIIAGGGAAGLSLACHLAQSPLRDRRVLIVEQDAKDQNDRTWCFWADHPTLFDTIISRSWSQFQVLGQRFVKTLDLHTYRYDMIRGIDFYRFAHQTLSAAPHVDFLQGHVDCIEDGDQEASVLVDGERYVGGWVFDSLFNWGAFHPDLVHYHCLMQQFEGWEIETSEQVFNPQAATFLYQIPWYTRGMPKRLLVQTCLRLDELATRYRATTDAVERSHWQIIWLLAQGKSTQAIAEVTGYSVPWIRTLLHRYHQTGPAGLADQRHRNPGGACLLSDEQQQALQRALDEPPPDGGLWSGPKVAAWITQHTGRQVHPQRGWAYLKRLQFSQRVLRPRHVKGDPAAQETFKKTCPAS